MPRVRRLVLPGFPHHVIARGNNRRRLFSYSSDYRRFWLEVERAINASDCEVHVVTIMSNHVHLLATPKNTSDLAEFVKAFSQRYAAFRNRRKRATGKLFEERYKSIPITSDEQLAVTTAYVEANPVRAGIVENPLDYQWSSYGIHVGQPGRSKIGALSLTPSRWYRALADEPAVRAERYAAWMKIYLGNPRQPRHGPIIDRLELVSTVRCRSRIERPDGSSAI